MTNAVDSEERPEPPLPPVSPEPPQPGSASSRRLWPIVSAVLSALLLLIVGYALYLFAFGAEGSPLARLTQSDRPLVAGFVEIDSPEVYTRERLVNDRFVEDSWLRTLLAGASARKVSPSLTLSDATRKSASVGQKSGQSDEAGGTAADPQPAPEDAGPPGDAESASGAALDGILTFKAQQLYRQTIRQAIIENQLDDTHDLQGNSLYLFKFDASVLPTEPDNRVLRIEMELNNSSNFHAPFAMADFIRRNERESDVLSEADRIYRDWLQGANAKLQRLRSDLGQAFERDTVGEDFSASIQAEFHGRFGFPLPGDASNPEALRASLRTQAPKIIEGVNAARSASRDRAEQGDKEIMQVVGTQQRNSCLTLGLVSSYLKNAPAFIGNANLARNQQAQADLKLGDAESEAVLEEIGRCLVDVVTTSWAVRLTFTGYNSSSGVATKVWNYIAPVYRSEGSLEFGPRTDYYLITFPELVGDCIQSEDCLQILGGYQVVGSLDLGDPANQALNASLAEAQKRPDCGDLRSPDAGPPTSILVYALSPEQLGAGLVSADGARPLPPDALVEILAAGGFFCSPEGLELRGLHLSFERGLYNFIQGLRERSQGFSYSVMPREDMQIVAREFDSDSSFDGAGGLFGVNGRLAEQRRRMARAVEGEATIVGYGTAQNVRPDEAESDPGQASVQFGWIVWPGRHFGASGGPVERQIPMQKSLSALVSIPAWWDTVHICGRYEWLDRESAAGGHRQRSADLRSQCRRTAAPPKSGEPAPEASAEVARDASGSGAEDETFFQYDVALPFEIDSLDSILFGQTRLLAEPTIFEWAMGDIKLTMCQPASIIIAGQRLWRSAVVTIGSQVADEIVVLPNMEGIVAKFNRVQFPDGAGRPVSRTLAASAEGLISAIAGEQRVVLTVWTSEGSVKYGRLVTLSPPRSADGSPLRVTTCRPAAGKTSAAAPDPPAMTETTELR